MDAPYYDNYWSSRDTARTRARSRRRAEIALGLLSQAASQRSLLEVGCGPGWALDVFAAGGFAVRGIDLSPAAVEHAREQGHDAHVLDISRMEIEASYDVVAALEVLEHTVDPLGVLERLTQAVRVGGQLVVSLPNEFSLARRVGILFGRPGFGGHDDPHVRHFDVAAARRLFEAAGLAILAHRFDGLLPPRWGVVKRIVEPAVGLWPGLLALSGVYLLARPGEATSAGSEEMATAQELPKAAKQQLPTAKKGG